MEKQFTNRLGIVGIIIFLSLFQIQKKLHAQNTNFDKLEQLYDQRLYKIVFRKSLKMTKKSEFDFSEVPAYYLSISTIQRSQNEFWFKNNVDKTKDAFEFLTLLKQSEKGKLIFDSHISEISELKISIDSWLTNLKLSKNESDYEIFNDYATKLFTNLTILDEELEIINSNPNIKDSRVKSLINEAEKHLGVAYVFGGSTPSGFDCSGFTKYVFNTVNIQIPRIAKDQFLFTEKIKLEEVRIGDLVFFTHGGPIAHVGIIYNVKGNALEMIHASSSKGIQIISLTDSKYWQSRIYAFGRAL